MGTAEKFAYEVAQKNKLQKTAEIDPVLKKTLRGQIDNYVRIDLRPSGPWKSQPISLNG
jgi:hypothetical protein